MTIDPSLVSALSAVMGSLAGASASIFTTWMTQRNQNHRERSQLELRRREVLYGEFIAEGFKLTADATEHSLDHPETLVNLYTILGRIRLVSSDAIVNSAEEFCRLLIDRYMDKNIPIEEIPAMIRDSDHPLRGFASECRAELDRYTT
ncbi:hypothetical protein [Luteolibacter soli]|uniref:DUF4760 domain-containing protein n=1 Tax=Luteolibacter soli TaxID=3135280 RepID=A0ABU9B335_9BACT